jgi:hypothetical protein
MTPDEAILLVDQKAMASSDTLRPLRRNHRSLPLHFRLGKIKAVF